MTLSDFRCHFQALSPPIMKRYASMFVSHDERKVRRLQLARSYKPVSEVFPCLTPCVCVCQAVEELLVELDVDKKSIILGASRVRTRFNSLLVGESRSHGLLPAVSQVFMKRGVLRYLEQQRDQKVTGWLVYLQAACMGHLARQKYRKLKVSGSLFST